MGRYLLYVPHPGKTACMDNLSNDITCGHALPRTKLEGCVRCGAYGASPRLNRTAYGCFTA